MANPLLYNLFWDLSKLKGIGPKRAIAYKRLGCNNVRDLIFHFPTNVIDRRYSPPISQLMNGVITTQILQVKSYNFRQNNRSKAPHKINCANDSGEIVLIYFNAKVDQLKQMFPLEKKLAVSGKVEINNYLYQIVHPDIVANEEEADSIKILEPVYPSTYGLNSRFLGLTIKNILKVIPNLPEWLPQKLLEKMEWVSWLNSLKRIHTPQTEGEIFSNTKFKERVIFDGLLAQQLTLQIARKYYTDTKKIPLIFTSHLRTKLLALLPFKLTDGQISALDDIEREQKSEQRISRLILGDVGSGKTLIALIAMLNVVEAQKQAVLMVPTEILAKQHFQTITNYCDQLGIKSALLISNLTKAQKDKVYNQIEQGEIDVIIGTHALFQDKLKFKELSLVVIDEQHRFGVEQRLSLSRKGVAPDFLMMSATPIPRTLCMVQYGDLDISVIRDKPIGRLQIITSVISEKKLASVMQSIRGAVEGGEKIYWICPLIEESQNMDLTNLLERFQSLIEILPQSVGCVHGKMNAVDRDSEMQKFLAGDIKVLVATTVIEVGVDVKDATIIIIENAERFGLSQLHQLRGRVGRSEKQSYCILLHKAHISEDSYLRLKAMKETQDGFEIAEQDLKIRGGGEVLGSKQSGHEYALNMDFALYQKLITYAHNLAHEVIKDDPELKQNINLRLLLELYDFHYNVRYIRDN